MKTDLAARSNHKHSQQIKEEDLMRVNNSIQNNPQPTYLDDFPKKSTLSSYRTKDNKLEALGFARKYNKDFDTRSEKESNKRAYSVKELIPPKASLRQIVFEKKVPNDYNQNLLKLKLQEMAFKFKTKIATLLKQINTPLSQFSRFTSLSRIDDILDFLAENVKKSLNNNETKKQQSLKMFSKERELIQSYEQQIQNLKKKQLEKETIEKTFKAKLKESHAQIRDLYDKVNQKQREISQKMTEVYQLKSVSKQSEKLVQNYKLKCLAAEKQLNEQLEKQNLEANKLFNTYKHLEEQNIQLKQKNEELTQTLKNQKEKESKILSLNQHLSQEIERWKERLSSNISPDADRRTENQQSRKAKQNEESGEINPLAGKLSTLTLENQTKRLNYKIKELQKQIRHLQRQLINYLSTKEKYDNLLTFVQSNNSFEGIVQPGVNVSDKWKLMIGEQQLFEVQYFYKKKIEQIVKQWRDKMVQIITKNQQEEQKYKNELSKLQKANEELENKVYELANQKYNVENKLIEKERELYEMSRKNNKSLKSNTFSVRTQTKSEVIMMSVEGQNNNEESGLQSIDEKNI